MKKTFKKSPYNLGRSAVVFVGLLGASSALAQNNTFSPGVSAITPITQSVETGPTLDVVPYVLADGYTINLALIPSDIEFAGYAQPNLPQLNAGQVGNLNATILPTVYPTFTVRQLVTTVNVWDNQTVVLGGLITSTVNSTKNKIPIAGDLPIVGRLFQSQSKQTAKNNLMIFVTATIVDPAGQRVHSDDELPFAQSTVPVQSSENVAPSSSEKSFMTGQIQSVQ